VRPSGPRQSAIGVWHVWHDTAAYVLSGGIEQSVPPLSECAYVTTRSKDRGQRVLTWVADVGIVQPGSAEWDAVVPLLLGKRLNLPDGEKAPERWVRECTLYRLSPTGEVTETPDAPSTSSHAMPPPPSPARSRVPRPLHLRGRPLRRGRRTP
jgi:hypothetical protein